MITYKLLLLLCLNERVSEWMNEWVNEWVNGLMNWYFKIISKRFCWKTKAKTESKLQTLAGGEIHDRFTETIHEYLNIMNKQLGA